LREDSVAAKMAEIFHAHDGKEYDLQAYCLMPNHVHMLATCWKPTADSAQVDVERSSDRCVPANSDSITCPKRTEVRSTTGLYILASVLKQLKGVSAYECNKLLVRRGAFWHHESYDHVIRNDDELERTAWYILSNPVKAGLCRYWRDWRWTYLKDGVIET
jgi:REP element-mobilizing transposase RayT